MMGHSKILVFIFVALTSSCSFFSSTESSTYTKSASITNQIPTGYKNWKVVKSEGADFALQNKATNNIFLVNSSCRKFESSNLNTLTSSMLSGIESMEISKKEVINLYDRDALSLLGSGKVDGVKTFFSTVTLQKNSCIYDYALISSKQKSLEKDLADFKEMILKVKID